MVDQEASLTVGLSKLAANRNRVRLCGLLRLWFIPSLVRLLIAVLLQGYRLLARADRARQQSMLIASKSTMPCLKYWARSKSDYEIQAVAGGTRLEK